MTDGFCDSQPAIQRGQIRAVRFTKVPSMSITRSANARGSIHLDVWTLFKLTSASCPRDLDGLLSARGYGLESDTAVRTVDLVSIPEKQDPHRVTLFEGVSDEWLSAFLK